MKLRQQSVTLVLGHWACLQEVLKHKTDDLVLGLDLVTVLTSQALVSISLVMVAVDG